MAGHANDRTPRATPDDLLKLPEAFAAEIIGGAIVQKANSSFEHGNAQAGTLIEVRTRFRGHPGGSGTGGWWIVPEVEVVYEETDVYRHDLVGWRRDRVSERPQGRVVRVRPDWAFEVLSPSPTRRTTRSSSRGSCTDAACPSAGLPTWRTAP
jgi:Uma2 family endonuclease